MQDQIQDVLDSAIEKREALIKDPYQTAFRLINGFLENMPNIIIEVFARTVVFHNYASDDVLIEKIIPLIRKKLPWIKTGIIKRRGSKRSTEQAGRTVFGENSDTKIEENGVLYSVNLMLNQDSSFYLDTKELRAWIKANMRGKRVLNTFAYTGSMGISALSGGAIEVIQLDLNRQFLSVAMRSAKLNGYPIDSSTYHTADFWSRITHYKKIGKCFDCVILDPPVYSKTNRGTIDVSKNYHKLINKVRPIIAEGGHLITINNALFQRGVDHHKTLELLCEDGYLNIESIIPVPTDCFGEIESAKHRLPVDPSPYNHATKITVLRVKKKRVTV